MKVRIESVITSVEVILYSDETKKIIVLNKSEKQLEYKGKQVIPLCPTGRLIEFNVRYEGEYFKSFVAGRNKRITAIGHVIDDISIEDVLKAIERGQITYVDSDYESNILLFFIE